MVNGSLRHFFFPCSVFDYLRSPLSTPTFPLLSLIPTAVRVLRSLRTAREPIDREPFRITVDDACTIRRRKMAGSVGQQPRLRGLDCRSFPDLVLRLACSLLFLYPSTSRLRMLLRHFFPKVFSRAHMGRPSASLLTVVRLCRRVATVGSRRMYFCAYV